CRDCDDDNPYAWTPERCATCRDADGDGAWVECDAYGALGQPDCSDADAANWISCASCVDQDHDGWFRQCDDPALRPSPDCDDEAFFINPGVDSDGDGADDCAD